MDWNLAIERNSEALKRILAMLVAMAALTGDDSGNTLPRHLHRAILRLVRPAESAVRRLVIVIARGLVVTLPPPRPRKTKPASIFLKKPGGTGIYLPPGVSAFPLREDVRGPAARTPSLPLLDPLRRSFHPRPKRPVQTSIPRISFPCYTAPSPITPYCPPAPDDPLDATRLALRLKALGAALDDLPGQAKRFARWQMRKRAGRDAAGAQNKSPDAAGAQNRNPDAAGAQNRSPDAAGAQNKNPDAAGAQNKRVARRVWPLRPGRAPGQRPARHRTEVHEVLNDLHWLAFEVLEHRDTS